MAGGDLCCAQARHGSAPDIQGRDLANRVSTILSVAMLAGWLGERQQSQALPQASQAIDAAVDRVPENPATRTADLGGTLGRKAFGDAAARALRLR